MADSKISALPSATTPLAGTEVLPIVQGGVTDQVSVANLTAGRAVSVASLTATGAVVSDGNTLYVDATNHRVGIGTGAPASKLHVRGSGVIDIRIGDSGTSRYAEMTFGTTNSAFIIGSQGGSAYPIKFQLGSTEYAGLTTTGFTLNNGNLIIGTAGKGIDFSAASHAAGMTSELLNDYEEGTWTPELTAASGTFTTVTLNASAGGVYTKVGRLVTFQMWFATDAITVGTASSDIRISLPFAGASGLPGSSEYSALAVSYVASWAGDMPLAGTVRGGEAKMNLTYRTAVNGVASLIQVGDLGTGANANNVIVSGSYVAA